MSDKQDKDLPFNPLLIYREQGYDSLRKEQYEKAVTAFDKAYRVDSECKRTILGRCMANSNFAQYEAALMDAEMALSLDENAIMAQYLKSQALYEMGEFETALVNFHKGLRRRKCPKSFEAGVMQAEETVEDCIGRNVGPVLMDFAKTILKMEDRKKKVALGIDDTPPLDEVALNKQQQRQEKMDRIMGEKYLGRLAKDKIFLYELRQHPALSSPNRQGSLKLQQLVMQGGNLLKQRQDILRTRMPFYAIKYREATVSAALKRRKEEEFLNKQLRVKEDAKKALEKLRELRANGDMKLYLEMVDRTIEFFDNKSKKILPKKAEYLEALYSISALMFLDQKHMKNQSKRMALQQINFELGLPDLSAGSKDHPEYQPVRMPVIDTRKVIKSLEDRLVVSQSPKEKAWIYYELARIHYDINKVDLSRLYAKKCIIESKPINNYAWCVNAGWLVTKIEIGQHNKTDAKAALQDSLDSALKLNEEGVIKYLMIAMEALEDADFDDIADNGIEVREKTIIKMMSSDLALRGDMEYLFRRMSVMPANRRMSLMPGIKPTDKKRIVIDIPPSPTDSLLHGKRKSVSVETPGGGEGKPRKSVQMSASHTITSSPSATAHRGSSSTHARPGKPLESAVSPHSAIIRRRSIGFASMAQGIEED